MAAPKKCKSLRRRRIAQGNKIKRHEKGFTGLAINYQNVSNCSYCKKVVLSHTSCKACVINNIKKKTLKV